MVKKVLNNMGKFRWFYPLAFVLIVVVFAVSASPAQAFIEKIYAAVGNLMMSVVSFLGSILLIFIYILIKIFQYTDFISTPAVQIGWVIIRDVANIMIVVMLMVIAFSNIIRVNRFAISQNLLRLIIAAFLVNFSLLFTGLMIDASQVVMMHFVKGFREIAAGNLTVGMGVEGILKFAEAGGENISDSEWFGVLGSIMLAGFILVISIGVILAFIVFILARIVILWFLAIFSPVAYIGSIVPGLSQYSSQWWSHLSKQLTTGPMIAFGFWLSMVILNNLSANDNLLAITVENVETKSLSQAPQFLTDISSPQRMLDFMVVIGLLMGTLWITQQAGGIAGSFAGKVKGGLINMAKKYTGLRAMQETWSRYKSIRESERSEKAAKRAAFLQKGVGYLKKGVASPVTLTKFLARKGYEKGLQKIMGKESPEVYQAQIDKLKEEESKAKDPAHKAAIQRDIAELEKQASRAKLMYNPFATLREKAKTFAGSWLKNKADQKKQEIDNMQEEREKSIQTYTQIQELFSKGIDNLTEEEKRRLADLVGVENHNNVNDNKVKEVLSKLKEEIHKYTSEIARLSSGILSPENYRRMGVTIEKAIDKISDATKQFLKYAAPSLVGLPSLSLVAAGVDTAAVLDKKGKKDIQESADYVYKEVSKIKDTLKNLKNNDINNLIRDVTADKFSRLAAILEAFERGLIKDKETAIEMRNFAGSLGADSKTTSVVDAHMSRQFPQEILSRDEIVEGLETGKVDISQMQPGAFRDGDMMLKVLEKVLLGYLKDLSKKPGYGGNISQGILEAANKWREILKQGTGKGDLNEALRDMVDTDGNVKDMYAGMFDLIAKMSQVGDIKKILDIDDAGGFKTKNFQNVLKALIKSRYALEVLKNIEPGTISGDVEKVIGKNIDLTQLKRLAHIAESDDDQKKVKKIIQAIRQQRRYQAELEQSKNTPMDILNSYLVENGGRTGRTASSVEKGGRKTIIEPVSKYYQIKPDDKKA